jgi:molecular chaperone GrpE (heat shock protein)
MNAKYMELWQKKNKLEIELQKARKYNKTAIVGELLEKIDDLKEEMWKSLSKKEKKQKKFYDFLGFLMVVSIFALLIIGAGEFSQYLFLY